jgi:hypothetical protein
VAQLGSEVLPTRLIDSIAFSSITLLYHIFIMFMLHHNNKISKIANAGQPYNSKAILLGLLDRQGVVGL